MPPENQRHVSISELLDDIHYVNQSNKVEIQLVRDRFQQQVTEADLSGEPADALTESVSAALGQLAAKVKLTEKAIQSLQAKQKNKNKPNNITATSHRDMPGDSSFSAETLAGTKNLLPLETSANGISFCWTGADPETRFSFNLDRSKRLEMQIRVFALIKPEYSKLLKVFVNDVHIKHQFIFDGSVYVVSCVLPVSSETSKTDVKIILPDTHCPTDLNAGLDGRTLGIAISGICFTEPAGTLSRWLKRLRLTR